MAWFALTEMLILFGIVVVLPLIIICVILGRKRGTGAAPIQQPSTSVDPAERNRQRELILEKLAKKELSREDAEQELLELDKPLPEQMPAPPPAKGKGCGAGCLAAIIAGLIAFILLVLLLLGFVGIQRVSPEREVHYHVEEVR